MQPAAFAAQPCARRADVAVVQIVDQRVKGRAMVHMPQMRDLVRDHRTADRIGRLHQPPVEPQHAFGRAAAPALARPAQPDRRGSELAARAIVRRIFGEQAQGFLFEPALEPLGKRVVRSAQRQPAAIQPRAARCIAAPVDGKLATAAAA